jgi:hypothetical protein
MENMFLGVIAGFISLLGFLPYIIGILKKEVIPNRVTWIIWTIVQGILLFSYIKVSGGVNASMWVPVTYVAGPFIVMLLSFYYGEGGFGRLDITSFILSVFSIVLWIITGVPIIALLANMAADALAAVPTIYKTYQRPHTESFLAWGMFLAANTLNLFIVPNINFQTFIFPCYLFLLSCIVCLLICRKYISHSSTKIP